MNGVIYQYKIGEKFYVGKTYMKQRKRMDKHKYEALTLKKDHPFCKAIRKYGWETAKAGYSVIEEISADTKEELNALLIQREAFWIKERNSIVPNGYNIYKSGQIQIPHTKNKEDIYRRVSESLKGKYLNCESTSRKVYCIDQDKWYPSVREAERQNNICFGSVEKSASGKNITAGGLRWSYDGSRTSRKNLTVESRKPVYCIETGEVYESVYGAAKRLFGDSANKKKGRIQASIKKGWAVDGKHYKLVEQDNPVLSETEV